MNHNLKETLKNSIFFTILALFLTLSASAVSCSGNNVTEPESQTDTIVTYNQGSTNPYIKTMYGTIKQSMYTVNVLRIPINDNYADGSFFVQEKNGNGWVRIGQQQGVVETWQLYHLAIDYASSDLISRQYKIVLHLN